MVDPESAANIWGGQFRKASAAQIFAGKYIVEEFDPFLHAEGRPDVLRHDWTGPYFRDRRWFVNGCETIACSQMFTNPMTERGGG